MTGFNSSLIKCFFLLETQGFNILHVILVNGWLNVLSCSSSPECTVLKQHPSVVFNGLDHYTPLYVLNSSTNIGVLPKSAVIAQLSNKLLYNSSCQYTDTPPTPLSYLTTTTVLLDTANRRFSGRREFFSDSD